jgi:hypothetical protein
VLDEAVQIRGAARAYDIVIAFVLLDDDDDVIGPRQIAWGSRRSLEQ